MKPKVNPDCPCGSGQPYSSCCAPLHHGQPAPDAEALMRARYCAYVFELESYLLETWHHDTRPVKLGLKDEGLKIKWFGLEVKNHVLNGSDRAAVEFVARFRVGGRAQRQHEVSCFVREENRWYYLAPGFAK